MAFQFKIQLNRISKPPVTRELVVNDNISFHKFHEIIQIAMGWAECHLYMFSPKGYGSFPKFEENTPDAGIDFAPISYLKLGYDGTFDSGKVKLKDYFEIVKDQITYIYDFGDDWKHTITLIKITDLNVDKPFQLLVVPERPNGLAQSAIEMVRLQGGKPSYAHTFLSLSLLFAEHPIE